MKNCLMYCIYLLDLGIIDYTRIPIFSLTFGPTTSSIDIPIDINNDGIFEITEMFSTALSFPGDPIPRVTLLPDSALITIFDDDG